MQNDKQQSLTFNDIPQAMSEVLDELRQLKTAVEKMNQQPPRKARMPVDIKRASEITGLAVTTLYRYTSQGLIPCYKKGKKMQFYEDELADWMNASRCSTIEERIAGIDNTIIRLDRNK